MCPKSKNGADLFNLKHSTSIGAAGDAETKVEFYSVYMHLQQVTVELGKTVYRKDMLGTAGASNGQNAIHMEIVCDDDNLKKLVGRTERKLNIGQHGRTDAVYGDMHFYLPAGALIYAGDKSPGYAVQTPTATSTATTENLYITLRYQTGDAVLTTRKENLSGEFEQVGKIQDEHDAEYNLYKTASDAAKAINDSNMAVKPPASGLYELFRFGRVINTPHETAIANGSVPHWRKISHPGGEGWVDLNAANVKIFSDADFPHWVGWQLVDDDTTPDSQCNSPIIQAMLDSNHDGQSDEQERMAALNNSVIQQKLARTICKFPTEWEAATIDTRFSWLKSSSKILPDPLSDDDYSDLKAHIEKLCFWVDIKSKSFTLPSNHWHFHPKEFIRWFRRCGWLSEGDLVRVTRETVIDIKSKKEIGTFTVKLLHKNLYEILEGKRPANLSPALQKMMRKYGIISPHRTAYLMSQLAQETGRLMLMVEQGGDSYFNKYEPGTDQGNKLGNAQKGDGLRFKGRGLIQITGRDNYKNYGKYRGKDFLSDSAAASLVTDAYLTCDASGAFWTSKQRNQYDAHHKLVPLGKLGINYWADIGVSKSDAQQVTKCINTGCDGFDTVRWPCFEHAWYALNDETTAPANFKPILT